MWVFSQNTIAGDLGVTPIIQCLASMLITSTLVHTDLHHHAVAPLPFVYPHVDDLPDPRTFFTRKAAEMSPDEKALPEEKKGLRYHYLMLIRFIFEGSEKNMLASRIPVRHWLGRLAWTAAQGAGIGIIFGFPLWCLAMVILGPIYGNRNMGNRWAPQVIKLVYAAILGWVTNPVIATLALGSQAEQHLLVVEHEHESMEEGGVRTIPEDEEFSPGTIRRPPPASSPGILATPPRIPRQSSTTSPSSARSRPPLTTDVSYIPPLTPGASFSLGRSAGRDGQGDNSTPPIRPGATSVSSPAESNRSYSYALGGTGGRAQRSRAGSRVSATQVPRLIHETSRGEVLGAAEQGGVERLDEPPVRSNVSE